MTNASRFTAIEFWVDGGNLAIWQWNSGSMALPDVIKSAHTLIAESVTAREEERGAENSALIPK